MTIICPSGSAPASGAPTFFTFDQQFLNANFAIAFAAALSPSLLGLPTGPQYVPDFCATPPLGDLPGAPDYVKLAFPLLAWISGTYTRFGEQAKEDAFSQYCVCNAAPPLSLCSCFTSSAWSSLTSNATNCQLYVWSTSVYAIGTPKTLYGVEVNVNTAGIPLEIGLMDIVSGAGTITLSQTFTSVAGRQIYYFTAPPTIALTGTNVFIRSATPYTFPFGGSLSGYVCSNTDFEVRGFGYGNYNLTGIAGFPSGYLPINPVWCGTAAAPAPPPALAPPSGFPSAPSPPTCGSFQDVCNELQVIENSVLANGEMLSLLRDGLLPRSLAESTVHAGLTGSGSLAVSGILGFKVMFNTVPIAYGSLPGNPAARASIGKVSYSDSEGMIDEQWVGATERFLVPPTTAQLGYFFSPGVVATIIELTRGP